MISNLDKYEKDLDRLIGDGELLDLAIERAFLPEDFNAGLKKSLKDAKEVTQFLRELPKFADEYQVWYSESLVVLRQLLPDRVPDFIKLYERPRSQRKKISHENYVIADALLGLEIRSFTGEKVVGPDAALPKFGQQLSIVKSIKRRFESTLFDIKQLVQADLFDSELASALELNKRGFVRGAGAVAGVVLEGHLLQVCDNHKVTVRKKNPGINDLAQLLKDASIIDTPVWRSIQHLADLRNLCDHKKKTEPKTEDIEQLIAGVAKITKTQF